MYITFFKRIIDIIIGVIVLPIFLILLLIIGILIKLEDNGPIFYKADRIGKNFNIFTMYKFRSMKVNSPNIMNDDGSTYNKNDDPRITKVGKILRESSLDEVPQIINVLKGEMSIIGPRPSLPIAADTYKYDERAKMKVRPGITGYNQAYFRNNIPVRERRLNEAWYAKNVSLTLDIKIFLKTILTVLKKEGIYTN